MARLVSLKKLFKHFLALSFISALTLGLASCSTANVSREDFSMSGGAPAGFNEIYDEAYDSAESAAFSEEANFEVDADISSSIIKEGTLRLQVKDQEATIIEVNKTVTSLNGAIENRYIYRDREGNVANSEMQLKIPSKNFDEAFAQLSELGVVIEDQRSETDVSLQKTDLAARINALETSVERLMKLMETSENVSDLLEAETTLSQRQQELDSLKAQLSVLEDQISYSRIWLTVSVNEIVPGGPSSFFDGIVLGFKSLTTFVAKSLITVGVIVPWLLAAGVITLIVVLLVKALTRKSKKSRIEE